MDNHVDHAQLTKYMYIDEIQSSRVVKVGRQWYYGGEKTRQHDQGSEAGASSEIST